MRLFIYVEGQEEELFVNRVLRGYLETFGVKVQKPLLAATSFRIGSDDITVGGVTNYQSIKADISDQFQGQEITRQDVLTTLIDLYALPLSFPGAREAISSTLSGTQKASKIEAAWKLDAGEPNFHPYIQVHEFEALVLTKPSLFLEYYPQNKSGIEVLIRECANFRTPEDINETKSTSPSHRILARIPSYSKVDGFRHLQDIGIPELKVHCPRFRAWIERCEKFFQ